MKDFRNKRTTAISIPKICAYLSAAVLAAVCLAGCGSKESAESVSTVEALDNNGLKDPENVFSIAPIAVSTGEDSEGLAYQSKELQDTLKEQKFQSGSPILYSFENAEDAETARDEYIDYLTSEGLSGDNSYIDQIWILHNDDIYVAVTVTEEKFDAERDPSMFYDLSIEAAYK